MDNNQICYTFFSFLLLDIHHFPLLPGAALHGALLHLGLEGPDDQEEVGPEHPEEAADQRVRQGQGGRRLQDVDQVHDEADAGQDDPGLHQANVGLGWMGSGHN